MSPHSLQHYDFTGLTPNDYMDMDLGSIFGLNSRFGAVLEGIALCPHGLLTLAEQLGLSKSTGPLLLEFS